ncbi:MAG: RHS repeat-associated core domain-containing protein [Candidatus Omnitrophota bacterium]
MFKKSLHLLLVVTHLVSFGFLRDAFAFSSQSPSYKITSDALSQGGGASSTDTGSIKLTYSVIGESCVGQPAINTDYTKLLMHADGSNGSASFTDESGNSITAFGDIHIDTSQSKFSGASALLDGNGDYLSIPDSDSWNFGAEDFTIDFWIRWNGTPSTARIINQLQSGGSINGWGLEWYPNVLSFAFSPDGSKGCGVWAPWAPAGDTWYHVAVTVNEHVLRFFVDGTQIGLDWNLANYGEHYGFPVCYDYSMIYDSPLRLTIGADAGNSYPLNGRLDEVRISKGIARWTSDFIPPQEPYDSSTTDLLSPGGDYIYHSENFNLEAGYLSMLPANPPIQIQAISNQNWLENESKENAFDLDDYFQSPDGSPLTYTVTGNQNITVAIDPQTHLVSFSQAQAYNGTEKICFTVSDAQGSSIQSNEVTLQVEGVDNPPVLNFIPDISIDEGALVIVVPQAIDLDNDAVTYTYSTLLNTSGQWQTDYEDAGLYTVTVAATDATGLSDTRIFHINVRNVNRPPVLQSLSDIAVQEGELVVVAPSAFDPDNDAVTYYYSAPLDETGKWLTNFDSFGTYTATITASDGIDTVSQDVNIIVGNVNRPPQISLSISKYTASIDENLDITIQATDPDSNPMTYIMKKDGVQISAGEIVGLVPVIISTTFTSAGDHEITLTVADEEGLSATVTQGLDIVDPNVNIYAINPVMGDFNGDCLSDLGLHNSDTGVWEICLSSKGIFTNAVDWLTGFGNTRYWAPAGGDFNGDGRTDVGAYNSSTGELQVALSTGTSFSSAGTWFTLPNPSASWQLLSGNFNGDKYSDIAFYNRDTGEVKAALGTGTGFSALAVWASVGPTGALAMGGDFNADGLTDICYFNKSTGTFTVAFSNTINFLDSSNWMSGFAIDKDPFLSDINHDGLTDIAYWENSGIWHYAISTGAAFIDKGIWLDNFGSTSNESGTTGDFNGDGIIDRALFDRDVQGINRWLVQLNGQQPCDLLNLIENGTGGKIQITYTYASQYDNGLLPFPVYVASSISLIDTLPVTQPQEVYTQNFRYAGGYFDASEREFRGFAQITVTDPITGNYTETHFFQGKDGQDGALKGQIEKILAFDGDDRQISQVVNTYEVKKGGSDENVLGFPALTEIQTTVWEENETSITTKSTLVYDNIGNPIKATDFGDILKTGDEKSTETTYAAAYETTFNRPTETILKDKDENIVSKKTFEYDTKGNLTQEDVFIFNPLTGTLANALTQYAYDDFGNLTTSTDALGRSVTTEYEAQYHCYPKKVTNVLNQSVQYTYDPKFGCVLSVTDPNNQTSQSTYDSLGRLLYSTNALGEVPTTYSYPDFNTKVTINALGLTSTQYVDGIGRKYKVISSGEDGDSSRLVSSEAYYNNRGAVEKESIAHYIDEDPSNISYIRYEYDLRGRIKKTISDFPGTSKDAESTINYISPLYTETLDPKGHKKGTLKDVYGNIAEVTEFTQGGVYKTTYEYDVQNNLIKLTDSQNNVSQIWYDSIGRKLKMDDPDMGIWTYEYDILGNFIKQTDAKNQILEFEYDELNRLTRKLANAQTIVNYLYDDPLKDNCIGRLSKVTDQSGSTEFFYDVLGREIKSTKTVTTSPDISHQYTVQREYDILGRLTNLTYPDNSIVNYSYDTNSGLLERVQGSADYVKSINYNAKGQIKDITYGNNTQTTYDYGQDLRLSRILTSTQNPVPCTLQDLNYIFDKNGNITTLTDNLKSNIRSFTYDDLDRLTQASNLPSPQGGYTNYNYQYDPIGNMTYKSDVGTMAYGINAGPHAVTFAGGYSYQYDANGNMTTGKNKTLEYDVENRIIKIIQPDATTDFVYDGDGGRVKKVTTSPSHQVTSETTYIGSLFEINTDYSDSENPITKTTKHIFAGSNKVCSVNTRTGLPDNPQTSYYHTDHLGSSNVITDETGAQASHYEYTPYGSIAVDELANPQTGSPVNYYFTGKELDKTGLYYYSARYYDPEIGRFVSADTLVQAPYDPQSLNRYAYCRNNPLKYTDPSGHKWSWKKFWHAAVGVFVGVVATMVLGPGGALAWYGSTMAAMIGGAAGGAVAGGLDGGWQGALIGAAMGGATGGLASWGGSTVAIGLFAAGVAAAGATGSWDSFAGGIVGGLAGMVVGNGINNSFGDSSGVNNQSSVSRGQGTQSEEQSIRASLREAQVLRQKGNLQAAYDKEIDLVNKYGWEKTIGTKQKILIEQTGGFQPNKPAIRQQETLWMLGKEPAVVSGIVEYRDGIPNFVKGWFTEQSLTIDLSLVKFDAIRTDMPTSFQESILTFGGKGEWSCYKSRNRVIYGVLTEK